LKPGLAFACDFDGTIAPRDVGAEFARTFAIGGRDEIAGLLDAWRSDALGSRQLTEAQCGWVRATRADAEAFVRGFALDPHFGAFVAEAEAAGDGVTVLSDGFEFYIDALLGDAGLGRLPRHANRLRFESGGTVTPEFPHEGGCGRCGNCKAVHVSALARTGRAVVLVGDGYSDRCAARAADHVVARGALAEWCADTGLPHHPFADFADVARIARALRSGRAPERLAS
jgi:2-hydroxy-3-keto-5-methylthiopentenyl-1-phosphate phosphatase